LVAPEVLVANRRLHRPLSFTHLPTLPLGGAADGLVKTATFSGNSARRYCIDARAGQGGITRDKIRAIKVECVAM
jgi:hypothetical protein